MSIERIVALFCLAMPPVFAASANDMFTAAESIEVVVPIVTSGRELHHAAGRGLQGERGAIAVLRQGNLASGLTDYSLIFFNTDETLRFVNSPEQRVSPKGEILVRFSTAGSEPAIQRISWWPAQREIAFLGTRKEADDISQVYLFNLDRRVLRQVTQHPDPIRTFDLSMQANKLVYGAEGRPSSSSVGQRSNYVFGADHLPYSDHILAFGSDPRERPVMKYVVQSLDSKQIVNVQTVDARSELFLTPIFIAPSGRWAVRLVSVPELPDYWSEYVKVRESYDPTSWKRLGWHSSEAAFGGVATGIQQFYLIDLVDGNLRPLLDAPATYGGGIAGTAASASDGVVAFSVDGKSVFVAQTYLPLPGVNDIERSYRAKTAVVAEVEIVGGAVRRVAEIEEGLANPPMLQALSDGTLLVKQIRYSAGHARTHIEQYRRAGQTWQKVSSRVVAGKSPHYEAADVEPDRWWLYGVNNVGTPPALEARDLKTGQRRVITDLNPQLKQLSLGQLEQLQWTDRFGESHVGGLLLPANYRPGRRYPLVIQASAFGANYTSYLLQDLTAMPGRLFAGRDIVVLQTVCSPGPTATDGLHADDGVMSRTIACYETAADTLVARGLVDRQRVGIIGFSTTGNDVHHLVTFSQYPFAAAVIVDSFQTSFFNYVMNYGSSRPGMSWFDTNYPGGNGSVGAQFLANGIEQWSQNSPMFHLDQIRTPLLYEDHGHGPQYNRRPCPCWDTYAVLKRAQRPIELAYFPDGVHDLARPYEQLASRQTILDWFAYWLKGEQRTKPQPNTFESIESLATQYERWRVLYAQQQAHLEEKLNSGADPATLPRLPPLALVH